MLIGGLNLEWVLFTVSILDTVSVDVKQDMERIPLWVGKNLGIGQATVVVHVSVLFRTLSRNDMSRWNGIYREA